jgi:alpha-glucosidase
VTTGLDLLGQPHHDGSGLYVSDLGPSIGDTVNVRVRVPHEAAVDEVYVRVTPDSEPKFVDAVIEARTETETWWSAGLVCHNPVTSYRFILKGGPGGYQWLNGTGVHLRDVPDAADFRIVTYDAPPAWARDSVVYQVFPDRFAKSVDRPLPDWALPAAWDDPVNMVKGEGSRQVYGGDLDGVRQHLDYIQELGASVLYLTPFFPARSYHRYDATSFASVDPLLGGDEALHRLVADAHARGLRVIGDFTTNHTGVEHEWFRTAANDPDSEERSFYFMDGQGEHVDYVAWLDVPSLPKLNYDSNALRQRLFEGADAVVPRWLTGKDGLDGWRVDVANMTGRYGTQDHNKSVARQMRASMQAVRQDALLVAEHCHDVSQDAMGDGWQGVMNYAGFTRPVWTWLRDKGFAPKFLGSPLMVPRLGGVSVMETMREFAAIVPWRTVVNSFNLVGSHDTTRVRSLVGEDARLVDVAAGLLFTMPGVPMMTYGDEIGMLGDSGEDGRRPMPWHGKPWDERLHRVYADLIAARNSLDPLRHGGLRWVHASEDALVFLRETATQAVLVHCARSGHDVITLPSRHLGGIEKAVPVYGRDLHHGEGFVSVFADGPETNIWQFPVPSHVRQ